MTNNIKMEWTKSLMSQLIELWEERPCLYDPKHKFYSNKHARVNALAEIAEQLSKGEIEVSADEVKSKINNIRSQFNHELTKMRIAHSGMSTDEIYEPSLWWFSKVEFLRRFIKTRKSKSNFQLCQDSQNAIEVVDYDEKFNGDTQSPDTDVSDPLDSSNSTEPVVLETPPTKRLKKAIAMESDGVIDETLKTLQRINASHEKIMQQTSTSANAEFGKFIGKELDAIDNPELLNEVKFQLHSVLYSYKKRYAELVRNTVVIEHL